MLKEEPDMKGTHQTKDTSSRFMHDRGARVRSLFLVFLFASAVRFAMMLMVEQSSPTK